MTPKVRIEESFVVRVWCEAQDSAGHWRGRALHVGSTNVRYFSNLSDLCEFITLHERLALQESAQRDRLKSEDDAQSGDR